MLYISQPGWGKKGTENALQISVFPPCLGDKIVKIYDFSLHILCNYYLFAVPVEFHTYSVTESREFR